MCRGLHFSTLSVEDFLHEDGGVVLAAETCSSLSVEVCNMHDDGTQILPFLWLSSYTLSLQPKQLLRMGITHIIDCRSTPFDLVSREGLKYLCLPVADEVDKGDTIKQHLLKSLNWIEDARRSGGCVLVHCSAGMSITCTLM
jgi:Dual specificity phosphatase, catalytic domain